MEKISILLVIGSLLVLNVSGNSFGSRDSRCPLNDKGDTVHLPHEYDCTLFYKCDFGEAVLQECPPGLHFNPRLSVCDWPEDAGCKKVQVTNPPIQQTTVPPIQQTTVPPVQQTTVPPVQPTVPGERDDRCPLENDYDFTVHLPHEYDCTLFYSCSWGEAILQNCPEGLHFNPILSVCDWPEIAGCEKIQVTNPPVQQTTTPPVQPTTTPPVQPTTTPPVQPTTTPPVQPTVPGERDDRCPLENDYDFTVHLPHKYDCTLFYKCDWGEAILQNCPKGLHFNPILSVCDWPKNAGCTPEVLQTAPPVTTWNPDKEATCPADNSGDVVHLPHEYDCTLFYKCDWGVPILQDCPEGLHFNRILSLCDRPEDAGCV
jgi:peptidoglycan hydrolase-like protein with peptidoglycan-binding domain